MKEYEFIITGAGPAGLFAGILAAQAGVKTLILEGEKSPGKKLLISGEGKCNLTNSAPVQEFFSRYGQKNNFVKNALMHFDNRALINFFTEHNTPLYSRDDGKVFPVSERSRDILETLLKACSTAGAEIETNRRVTGIEYSDKHFIVKTDTDIFRSSNILLAAGGFTYPSTGSRGDGYLLSSGLGHKVIAPRASLAAVKISDYSIAEIAGIACDTEISLFREDRKAGSYIGRMLFTHTGVSGPVIIDNSRDFLPGDILSVNFLPENSREEISGHIESLIKENGKKLLKNTLPAVGLPESLVSIFLKSAGIASNKKSAEVSAKERKQVINCIMSFEMKIERLIKKTAMCTAGGVSTNEIDRRTMESRIVPGLYFAGEIIDVDGDSGGYNIQFAFSSAALAVSSLLTKRLP